MGSPKKKEEYIPYRDPFCCMYNDCVSDAARKDYIFDCHNCPCHVPEPVDMDQAMQERFGLKLLLVAVFLPEAYKKFNRIAPVRLRDVPHKR